MEYTRQSLFDAPARCHSPRVLLVYLPRAASMAAGLASSTALNQNDYFEYQGRRSLSPSSTHSPRQAAPATRVNATTRNPRARSASSSKQRQGYVAQVGGDSYREPDALQAWKMRACGPGES